MPKTRHIARNNLSHNVPALLNRGHTSLAALARAYFAMEVAGQARGTIEAKKRDLERFLLFYQSLYGHDRPQEWYPSVTREFLKQLRKGRPAQATLVRIYASVRRFARWIHRLSLSLPAVLPMASNRPRNQSQNGKDCHVLMNCGC